MLGSRHRGRRLLRTCDDWPSEQRAADEGNELARAGNTIKQTSEIIGHSYKAADTIIKHHLARDRASADAALHGAGGNGGMTDDARKRLDASIAKVHVVADRILGRQSSRTVETDSQKRLEASFAKVHAAADRILDRKPASTAVRNPFVGRPGLRTEDPAKRHKLHGAVLISFKGDRVGVNSSGEPQAIQPCDGAVRGSHPRRD